MRDLLDILQNRKWLTVIGGVGLALALIATPTRVAQTAPNITLVAKIQDQQCRGPEFVYVTLTATLSPPQRDVRYAWDFNSDGIYDTVPSPNPTVTHFYPDGTNQVATVKVIKGTRTTTASVSFDVLQCPN